MRVLVLLATAAMFIVLGAWLLIFQYSPGARTGLAVAALAAGLSLIVWALYRARHDFGRKARLGLSGGDGDPLWSVSLTMGFLLLLIPLSFVIPPMRELIMLMVFEKSGISQIILAVAALGSILTVFQYFELRRELMAFAEAKAALSRLPKDDPKYPEQMSAIHLSIEGCALKSKWTNMLDSRKTIGNVPDFEILTSLVDEREMLRESKVVFSIKALPLLGLFGTVVGFSVALVGMKEAAANMVDFNSFKGNMMSTLGGMQTAFLTTMGGIGGMLLVLLLNSMLCEARRRIMLLEDEFLYIHVYLPMFKSSEAVKGHG